MELYDWFLILLNMLNLNYIWVSFLSSLFNGLNIIDLQIEYNGLI